MMNLCSTLQSELNLADLWKDTEFVSRLEATKGNREGLAQLFCEKVLYLANLDDTVSCTSGWYHLLGRQLILFTQIAYSDGQYYRIDLMRSLIFEEGYRLLGAWPISWEEAREIERDSASYQAEQQYERGGEYWDVALEICGFQEIDGDWKYMHYKVDDLKNRPLRLRLRTADTSAR